MDLVLLLRLILFLAAFYGVCCLLNRRFQAPPPFVPIMACCLLGCALLVCGVLNLLFATVPLFVLCGLYGLFYEAVKGGRFRALKNPAVLLFLAASLYFFYYFYGHYITAGDDFNNWAIVPRVMLRYDRLPRFTDTVILFPSYPTGSAGIVYLVCRVLGSESGGSMLFAQTFLLLAALLPLFALVRRCRPASFCVILLAAAVLLTMNEGAAIQSLYVDTLLALVCLSGVVIALYDRERIEQRWIWLLPIACFLAVTKGSGLYFSVVTAALALLLLWKRATARERLRAACCLLLIPVALLLVWNLHADLVFEGGSMTRHSTSLRYMLRQTLQKDGGELWLTCKAFFATMGNFAEMRDTLATFGLLLGLALTGRLLRIRTPIGPGALLGASAAIYAGYMLGLLGMYLFNMPEGTVESFSRYVSTVLLLLFGFGTVYLIALFNALPESAARVPAFALSGALLVLFCLAVRPPLGTLARYPDALELSVKALDACMPVRDKDTRYLVYVWDGHREQTYGHRMVHYTAYPAQSDIASEDDNGLAALDDWTARYDYFIAFWTDDAYEEYAAAHGLDPTVKLWTPEAYLAAYRPAALPGE